MRDELMSPAEHLKYHREVAEAQADAAKPKQHIEDADCTLDNNDCCIVCGAWHGDPCPVCGARGYHRFNCSEISQ